MTPSLSVMMQLKHDQDAQPQNFYDHIVTLRNWIQYIVGCNNGIGGFHQNLVNFKRSKMPDF